MAIDFHDEKNKRTYTTRLVDSSWIHTMKSLFPTEHIYKGVDIGCGGGIYSKALVNMGIDFVTGVDFSEEILKGARENCVQYPNISFKHGHAFDTGLDSHAFDLVLERALVHHLDDLQSCFKEAYRLLNNDGYYVIQDRTPEDCFLAGNDQHIRGFLFESFPKLMDIEAKRRHDSESVINHLRATGFKNIKEVKLWETRKIYESKSQLIADLKARTGRSILHELNDQELNRLVNHIDQSLTTEHNIIEKDRWTIWVAIR